MKSGTHSDDDDVYDMKTFDGSGREWEELEDFVVVGVETRQLLEAVTSEQAVESYYVVTLSYLTLCCDWGFWDDLRLGVESGVSFQRMYGACTEHVFQASSSTRDCFPADWWKAGMFWNTSSVAEFVAVRS